MAQKKPESSTKTTVRRIKATDDAVKKTAPKTVKTKSTPKTTPKTAKVAKVKRATKSTDGLNEPVSRNPFKALGGYFKGAWHELKQVRWPNRLQTWAMTLAVLLFTGFFLALIVLLDAGFKWMFEQILR